MDTQPAKSDDCSDNFEQRASTPAKAGPVDHRHLRLYTMGDLQLEREVLDLFAGELPLVATGKQAVQQRNFWDGRTRGGRSSVVIASVAIRRKSSNDITGISM